MDGDWWIMHKRTGSTHHSYLSSRYGRPRDILPPARNLLIIFTSRPWTDERRLSGDSIRVVYCSMIYTRSRNRLQMTRLRSKHHFFRVFHMALIVSILQWAVILSSPEYKWVWPNSLETPSVYIYHNPRVHAAGGLFAVGSDPVRNQFGTQGAADLSEVFIFTS